MMADANFPVSPDTAVADLMECLVIGYAYDAAEERFVFVSDFPLRPRGGDRTFLALVLAQVSSFKRIRGLRQRTQGADTCYGADEQTPPMVVQSVKLTDVPPRRGIQLWFGPAFGGIELEFASIEAGLRETRAEQRSGTFVYRDIATGEPLDFFAPFPSLLERPANGARP